MEYESALQYYSYMLCDRSTSYLHRFGRLFHQYIVDQFSKIELANLNYFRFNQDHIRADLYQNIKDSNHQFGHNIGKGLFCLQHIKAVQEICSNYIKMLWP